MNTLDDLRRQRDQAMAQRQQAGENLTQSERRFEGVAQRPNEFQQNFKSRVRDRFNKRSAAVGQVEQMRTRADTAAQDRLQALAGADVGAEFKAAQAARAAAGASRDLMQAEESVSSRLGNLDEIMALAVQGLESEKERELLNIANLREQFNRATTSEQLAENRLLTEQARMDQLAAEQRAAARVGGSSTPSLTYTLPDGTQLPGLTPAQYYDIYTNQQGVAPEELYGTEPIYQTTTNMFGEPTNVKVGERQFFVDPVTRQKTYVTSGEASQGAQALAGVGQTVGNFLGRLFNRNRDTLTEDNLDAYLP